MPYIYYLHRDLKKGKPTCVFVGLGASRADALVVAADMSKKIEFNRVHLREVDSHEAKEVLEIENEWLELKRKTATEDQT